MVRLRSLDVRNIRGVRELSVDAADKSLVLLGPNGAGKSSIVDALDFLLTGEVRRLQGDGAGSLSLAEHGRNLLATPEDSWVEATFAVLEGRSKRVVKMKRTLANPSDIEWEGKPSDALVDLLDRVGRSGHHLLSRREILKYILAKPSERHEQVAALMQLDGIEELRKEFQGAAKRGREELKTHNAVLQRGEASVLAGVRPAARDRLELLAQVNERRAVLGGAALEDVLESTVRAGVEPAGAVHPLEAAGTAEALSSLTASLSKRADVVARLRALAAEQQTLAADVGALAAHRSHELLTRGRELLSGTSCPLCLHEWPDGTLLAIVRQRLAESEEASARVTALAETQSSLRQDLITLEALSKSLVKELKRGVPQPTAALERLSATLMTARDWLAPDVMTGPAITTEQVDGISVALDTLAALISDLRTQADLRPKLDRVRAAWDELGAVQRALGNLDQAQSELAPIERLANALSAADKLFAASRNEILEGIYASLSSRLQRLYASIHGAGAGAEKDFAASLQATQAGLKLEVDFYGKGQYPPAALHSEGHQDTLGICLFLALAEHVSGGPIQFLILDDVLMSVDAEHRRAVAEMLQREYPDTQFVITTHDEVWARQLKSVGIAGKPLILATWTLEGGTLTTVATKDPIVAARAALAEGRVETAAHALRRGLEERLRELCAALGGKVRFKPYGDFDLGDFRDAVKSSFNDALAKAKQAATSWGRELTQLNELHAAYTAASKNVQAEEWSVNATVHYNDWAKMSAGDFKPIIDAYEGFLLFFECGTCKGDLAIVEHRGLDVRELRCGCGQTNFNLQPKPKGQ